MSTQTGTETARAAASTAADEGKHLGNVGAQEAQNVAAEAKQQARNLVGEARSQVTEQTNSQRDRLVSTLQSLSSDLQDMADRSESSGLATEITRQAAQRVRDLSGQLDGREPAELLDEVRSFARRRPGMFLLGALTAGVVAGRVARGAKASNDTGSSTGGDYYASPGYEVGGGYDVAGVSEPASPTLGTGVPPVTPAYASGPLGDSPGGDPLLPDDDTRITGVRQEDPDGITGSGQSGSGYGGTP